MLKLIKKKKKRKAGLPAVCRAEKSKELLLFLLDCAEQYRYLLAMVVRRSRSEAPHHVSENS